MNQYAKCECHDCTQARFKMSFQGQIQSGVIEVGTSSTGGNMAVNGSAGFGASQEWLDTHTAKGPGING